ncbi:2Fe-2S iron-sulfur cluster-binding protein [Vacuolonema iberomarrocanum]|uniref:2Fe-2S iron-sulfur cluster-binding protein n=1 Tax=Vacuolonema iberomarrocanum TaxID=3454632 RepID=UPI0019F974C4|nr:(2Fe-2S)-binding protein [filamentous cyanobacterium LEGE 07170]
MTFQHPSSSPSPSSPSSHPPISPSISLHFPNTDYPAIAVDPHQPLYANLTLHNSPILFGCRTGICGTCLVAATGDMLSADADEQEVLDILAPHCPTVRLACQIHAIGDLTLTPLQQNPS